MTNIRPAAIGDDVAPNDLRVLRRRNRQLGDRLIALETEMADCRESHARELARVERELEKLREQLVDRSLERTRLEDEMDRLAERANGLEAELSFATTAPGRSPSVWRALVVDGSARAALPVCRSLGRAGHEVGLATSEASAIAAHSRATARTHWLPGPEASQESFRTAVNKVIAADGYDVLVATDDVTLARLSAMECPVPTFPVLGAPLDRLVDKAGLGELCSEIGTPYPRTFIVEDEAGLDQATAALGLPVVVKAARSAVVQPDGVRHRSGAIVARERDAALAEMIALREDGLTAIVQQFIHRRDKINLSIFRRAGRSEARFTYRVLRDVPLTGGIAMATETISPDRGPGADAVAALERLCDAAGYDGLANGEFCRSPDGRLTLIEVNPRVWGSVWFAERLGQRMIERGIRLALGLPSLPEVPYPDGRRFHHPIGELRWLRLQRTWREPLRELLATTGPKDVFDGADLSDVGPIVQSALNGLKRHVRRAPTP